MDSTTGSTLEVSGNSFEGPYVNFIVSSSDNSGNIVVQDNIKSRSGSMISIASASSIALPVYDTSNVISITGTTTINTISGAYGNRSFIANIVSGLTFSNSGNIANTFSAASGSVVTGVYSDITSKWYLS